MSESIPLGQVLNFATGRLITSMDDVYKFAEFMAGEPVMTHQLTLVFTLITDSVKEQAPDVFAIDFPVELAEALKGKTNEEHIKLWLTSQEEQHGATVELEPLDRETARAALNADIVFDGDGGVIVVVV